MELEQLHEAGSSQAEQRAAAEKSVADATMKVERLEETVREKKSLFEEADGELRAARAAGTATRRALASLCPFFVPPGFSVFFFSFLGWRSCSK